MKTCDRCGSQVIDGDEIEYHGQDLCETCYMDALSPVRACDPWAVRSAMSMAQRVTGEWQVNEKQVRILALLKDTGGADLETISSRLGMSAVVIMRELAALRHMEKVRAAMKNGRKIFVTW